MCDKTFNKNQENYMQAYRECKKRSNTYSMALSEYKKVSNLPGFQQNATPNTAELSALKAHSDDLAFLMHDKSTAAVVEEYLRSLLSGEELNQVRRELTRTGEF